MTKVYSVATRLLYGFFNFFWKNIYGITECAAHKDHPDPPKQVN